MSRVPHQRLERESVPNTLLPPPGYMPAATALQVEREQRSRIARVLAGRVNDNGRPLSPRAVAMLGQPCPYGKGTDNTYNKRGCRCEACRLAHRAKRLDRLHRARKDT